MRAVYRIVMLIMLGVLSTTMYAQDIDVTGVVTSTEDNLPLPGVTIQVKGSIKGTTTDFDGKYSIKVKSNDVLIFSYVGYQTIESAVKGRKKIDISLNVDAVMMDEVVVTALGIKRQKRELGYATEDVDGELVARSGSDNVINALSGRSAGVQIINPDGVAGGSSRIVIRGNNSIYGNNQPLIVVDGVPMSNEGGVTDISGGQDWGTALNNINQEDIEDISILKGPTAAALYGSMGGNGVVLITTKKGSKQQGLGVTYSTTAKITTPYLYREVQNKYGAGGPLSFQTPQLSLVEGWEDLYGYPVYQFPGVYSIDNGPEGEPTNTTFGYYGGAVSWGPEMKGEKVLWWDGVVRDYSPQPDNLSMLYKNGYSLTNNVSFSNSGDFGSIRVSITDQRSDAIIDNCNLQQTTLNVGATMNISKKIKSDISFTYLDYNRLNSPILGESYSNFNKGLLYSWPRSWQGIESTGYQQPDGTMTEYSAYPYNYIYSSTFWSFYNNNTTLNRDKVYGSARLTYDITDWLVATGKLALDLSFDQYETKNKPTTADGIAGGYYSHSLYQGYTMDADFLITAYKNNIKGSKFNVRWSVGGERMYMNNYGISAGTGTWAYANLYTFNNYESVNSRAFPTESKYEKQVNSLFSFLNISYNNYLFFDITGRNDWSSTLPANNNSYFYPSFTLSYVMTENLKNLKWGPVTFLKIRGSLAQTASDTSPYQLDFTYNTGSFGNQQSAWLPSNVPPLELKPQRQRSYELGFDLGLFNRLNFDFTYYYIHSWDQILSSPIAPSSGASNVTINTGVITNQGVEGILNYDITQGPNYYVQAGLNFSHNTNRIVDLGGAEMFMLSEIWGSNGPAIAVCEGENYGTIYGWDYVYQLTLDNGNTVGPFYDEAGNALPLLNAQGTEYLKTSSRVAVGNSAPWITGGVNMRAGYKNWNFSALIDAKLGGDIYCGSYVVAMQTGQSTETLYERDGNGLPYYDAEGNFLGNYGVVLPGVTVNQETGESTVNNNVVHYYYRYMPNFGGWGNYLTTPGIVANTWVKLREVTLSYDFPKKTLKKINFLQGLTLTATGRDLFYFFKTLPDNINPEGTIGSGNAQGLEYASFPGTRSFLISLKANL